MAGIMQLASDDNNPDFVGAHNPDHRLHARFYMRPVPNAFKSEMEHRPIFEDVLYVEIMTPGNQLNIIDVPAREDHKARFPFQWTHFRNTSGDGSATLMGTPLAQWPMLSPSACEMLKALKFYTVESIASASDEQLQHIGMHAGMQPLGLRDRAKTFLAVARDSSYAAKQEAELRRRDEEMAEMKKQLADMQALLAQATQPKQAEDKKRA